MRDYYEVLGVARNATDGDIKRAFRELARRYHPDSNPDDPEAEERFKEISVAYEMLSDPERRRRYDVFGEGAERAGASVGGAAADPFGFGDLFDAFFSGDGFGMRRGPSGPDAGLRRRGRGRARSAGGGLRQHRVDRRAAPGAVRPLRRLGLRARHAPEPVRRVRRER